MGLADSNPRSIPDIEVVAIRTSGPHDHIERVKFADGSDADAATVAVAINKHEAHYFMRRPEGKLLLRAQQCSDCNQMVLWA